MSTVGDKTKKGRAGESGGPEETRRTADHVTVEKDLRQPGRGRSRALPDSIGGPLRSTAKSRYAVSCAKARRQRLRAGQRSQVEARPKGIPVADSRAFSEQETLNARSEYTSDDSDGRSHHQINQYVIKEEIGRGSYGAVHLATDQFGNEYVSGSDLPHSASFPLRREQDASQELAGTGQGLTLSTRQ